MREDFHTPNPRAASRWQAHNAVEPLPASYGIYGDDLPTTVHECPPDCWHCATLRQLADVWAGVWARGGVS